MMLTATSSAAVDAVLEHAQLAITALGAERLRLQRWGAELHDCLRAGGLVLAAGNGGSATHAEHFVGELVGRFRRERRPLRAAALTTDSCAVTAIANDYGYDQVFARQVAALARPGDAVVLFSTSGSSPNVLAATAAARMAGARVLALTGPAPNPLADAAHDVVAVDAPDTASVQDAHHVAVHALCAAIDERVLADPRPSAEEARS
jgi:D-sedoheptulose 7-phosphate isomerase